MHGWVKKERSQNTTISSTNKENINRENIYSDYRLEKPFFPHTSIILIHTTDITITQHNPGLLLLTLQQTFTYPTILWYTTTTLIYIFFNHRVLN